MAKLMIEHDFYRIGGSESVGCSDTRLEFVVQTLDGTERDFIAPAVLNPAPFNAERRQFPRCRRSRFMVLMDIADLRATAWVAATPPVFTHPRCSANVI